MKLSQWIRWQSMNISLPLGSCCIHWELNPRNLTYSVSGNLVIQPLLNGQGVWGICLSAKPVFRDLYSKPWPGAFLVEMTWSIQPNFYTGFEHCRGSVHITVHSTVSNYQPEILLSNEKLIRPFDEVQIMLHCVFFGLECEIKGIWVIFKYLSQTIWGTLLQCVDWSLEIPTRVAFCPSPGKATFSENRVYKTGLRCRGSKINLD